MENTNCYDFEPIYKDGKLEDLNLRCRVTTRSGYVYQEYLLSTLLPVNVDMPMLADVLNKLI